MGAANLEPVIVLVGWLGNGDGDGFLWLVRGCRKLSRVIYDDVCNFLLFLSGICANDTSMNKTMTDFVGGVGQRLVQRTLRSLPIYSWLNLLLKVHIHLREGDMQSMLREFAVHTLIHIKKHKPILFGRGPNAHGNVYRTVTE
jgi:hypothetical protein